jgi:hypothetical protein
MFISSNIQTPSLFIMVRVSGAANFHMHHINTFGIQHIIIIGKIVLDDETDGCNWGDVGDQPR